MMLASAHRTLHAVLAYLERRHKEAVQVATDGEHPRLKYPELDARLEQASLDISVNNLHVE